MADRKIGLVIGTNNYKDPGIIKLNFAEDDARAIREILLDSDLCGFDEVIELIDKTHGETLQKIENVLRNADQSDTVLIYFSGHGKLDDMELCLLFKDTVPDSFLSTSIPFYHINQYIKRSKCKKIILIIDSCYSGAAGLKGGEDFLTKALSEASGEGKIILSASSGVETSKEEKDLKHGVFTNYLLEGLKTGSADSDNDGLISIDELYNYAFEKTTEKYSQTPMKKGEYKGKLIIGKNPKKQKDNIFKEKRKKILSKTKVGLPMDYYEEALNILTKDYEDPASITDNEKEKKLFLDALLEEKISIKTYIETILEIRFQEKTDELNISKQSYNKETYSEAFENEVLREDSYKSIVKEKTEKEEDTKIKQISELTEKAEKSFNDGVYRNAIANWLEILNLDPENIKAKNGIIKTEQILKEPNEKKKQIETLNISGKQQYIKEKHHEPIDEKKNYLDFKLKINLKNKGGYVVEVQSPEGEENQIMPLFDEYELNKLFAGFEFGIANSREKSRDIKIMTKEIKDEEVKTKEQTNEDRVKEFGQYLFNALFTDKVLDLYYRSRDRAKRDNNGLRLILNIQPPELIVLPWEYMYDLSSAEYLSLSSKRPIVRYLEPPRPIWPLKVKAPLHILGLIANPSNDFAQLQGELEKQSLEEIIKNVREQVDLTWMEGKTPQDLLKYMRSGKWNIFHYIGHGGFDRDTNEGVILLPDNEGRNVFLSASKLATLLADDEYLRLVVLNTCDGAKGSKTNIFSSTASILLRRGIPAVLAMQYIITDKTAILFARTFYEALLDGLPLDASVAEARKALYLETLEWGIPVLYMSSLDGVLFNFQM